MQRGRDARVRIIEPMRKTDPKVSKMTDFPGVVPALGQAISERGYETLTPVQEAVPASRPRQPRPAGLGPNRLRQDRRLRPRTRS